MQQWQNLLTKGNDFFDQKNWLEAENYYQQAEALLDNSWSRDTTNTDLLMAWICATHNLAALYEKQGEHTVSLQYLLLSHQRIVSLAQADYLNNKVKLTAIKTLKVTLSPILAFKQKHPVCRDCMASLMDINRSKQNRKTSIH